MASKNKGGIDVLPTRVSAFDTMIETGGIERGSTILISGGPGSGKTIFVMQSAYMGAKNGEKVIYISLEDDPEKIRKRTFNSFGWDLEALEKKGDFAILYFDPMDIEDMIRTSLGQQDIRALVKDLGIAKVSARRPLSMRVGKDITLPFRPDRVVIDSFSALSSTLESEKSYRIYVKTMLDSLRSYNSVNLAVVERQQTPSGDINDIEIDFLVDGIVLLYNIRREWTRTRAMEILKLRYTKHLQKMVPFKITDDGVVVYPTENVF